MYDVDMYILNIYISVCMSACIGFPHFVLVLVPTLSQLWTNFVPKIHADPTQPSPAQETCVSFVSLLPCFPHPGLSKWGTSSKNKESKERIICCPWLRASEAAVGGQEGHVKRCYAEGGGSMTATQQRQVTARNKNVTWLRAVWNKHRYEHF
jgi:hypothetical protein